MEGYHQYGGAKHAVILAQVQGQFELQSETVKKKKKDGCHGNKLIILHGYKGT
jgi:hypothetical protein